MFATPPPPPKKNPFPRGYIFCFLRWMECSKAPTNVYNTDLQCISASSKECPILMYCTPKVFSLNAHIPCVKLHTPTHHAPTYEYIRYYAHTNTKGDLTPIMMYCVFWKVGSNMVTPNLQLLLLLVSISFFCVCSVTTKHQKEPIKLEDLTHHVETVAKPMRAALNVLLIALPVAGHMSPSLALGEELVRRGHVVTLLTTTDSTAEKKMMEKVKVRGMTYVIARESLVAAQLAAKARTRKQEINALDLARKLMTFLPQEMAILGKSLDRYLATNSVDIMVGEDFVEPVVQCLGIQRNVKRVLLSTTLQYQPHTVPSWPWPGMIAGSVSDNLTFLQRLKLTLAGAAFRFFFRNVIGHFMFSSIQGYCPSVTLTQATAASGVYMPQIVPSVIGFEYPRTLSPLTTYVGPLLTRNPDPISTDLQEWLDSKEEQSVVYASMGSHMILNKEQGNAILNGVLSTNYSLLWSLRESNRGILDGVELDVKRVQILNWAPQLAVLGHRAIRMAVVHGGMNGIHESLYSGVPLIVLPINGDQMANAGRVHHQGLGIHLQDSNVTESSVFETIKQIDKGAYRENVQRLKKIFVDGGGRERAAELIEFYAEIGYSHLVPAYAKYDWSWVQYYNVDVYLAMTLLLLFFCYLTIKCCRCACTLILCRKLSKEKSD